MSIIGDQLKKSGLYNTNTYDTSTPSTNIGRYLYNQYDEPQDEYERDRERSAFWDSMPSIYKKAYNDSIGGMMYQIATGKKYYEIADVPRGIVHDVAAQMLSFFASKEDIGLMVTSGGLANVAIKGGIKGVVGAGVKKKAGEYVIQDVAKKRAAIMMARKLRVNGKSLGIKNANLLVNDVVKVGGVQAAMLGTYDGFYYAAKEVRDELLTSGEFAKYKEEGQPGWMGAFKEVMKNGDAKDYFRGGAIGLAGGIGRTSRFFSPFAKKDKATIKEAKKILEDKDLLARAANPAAVDQEAAQIALKAAKDTLRATVPKIGRPDQKNIQAFAGETVMIGALSPVAYEGRIPGLQDLILATGTAAALTAPMALGQKRAGRIRDELYAQQDAEVKKMAAYQDIVTKETQELYEQVSQPFAAVKDLPRRAYRDEDIFKLDGKNFAYTNIFGKKYARVKVGEGGSERTVGKIEGTVEEKLVLSSNKTKLPFLSSTIVPGSMKQTKKGMTVDIDLVSTRKGTDRYQLDELNTELFFKFHSEDNALIKSFNDNLQGRRNSKTFLEKHYDTQLRSARQRAMNSEKGYVPEDWNNALVETMNRNMDSSGQVTGWDRWAKTYAKKGEIRIKDMTIGEKRVIAKQLQNQRSIRTYINDNFPDYDTNLMFQPTFMSNPRRGILANFVTPFYYHISDPYGRKVVRLVQNVSDFVEQKTSQRADRLQEILTPILSSRNTHKKWWAGYVDGTGAESASKDFRTIEKLDVNDPGNGFNIFMKGLDRDIEVSKGLDKERLMMKKEFFTDMDKLTTTGTEKDFGINSIWSDAKQAQLNLAPLVRGYLPKMFKKEVLDVLFDKMATFEQKYMELTGGDFNLDGHHDAVTMAKIESRFEGLVKSFTRGNKPDAVIFKRVWNTLAKKPSSAGVPKNFNVFRLLNHQMYTNSLKPFSPLEKPRKLANLDFNNVEVINMVGEAHSDLLETNVQKLMTEYILGSTKRIELSKAFTPTGALLDGYMRRMNKNLELDGSRIPSSLGGQFLPFAKQTQHDAVEMIVKTFTGEYNYMVENPLTESFQSLSNLEMMGKISLGQAFIPNLTQSFISTAVEQGFGSFFKATVRLFTDADFRKRAKAESGSAILTSLDELFTGASALELGAREKMKTNAPTADYVRDWLKGEVKSKDFITFATKKTSFLFSKVNAMNQVLAAATAEEAAKKFAKILKGGDTFTTLLGGKGWAADKRKAWATEKLRRLGLSPDDVLNNFDALQNGVYNTGAERAFKGKLLRGMKKFARQTQLQRDLMMDPIMFNDPMVKPLLLFKRFGLRQFNYMRDTMTNEVKYGNVLPILRLGVGGFAGGQFVMWAKDNMNKVITGEEEYYSKTNRMKTLRTPEWQDYINAISSVGAFGVVGDIISDSDPKSAIEFFVKPVVFDDFQRVLRSWDTFSKSMQTHYPEQWDVPFRKGLNTLAPIAGPIFSRTARSGFGVGSYRLTPGLETEDMSRERIESRKRTALEDVRNSILDGQTKQAERIMLEYNRVYGSRYPNLRITSRDITWKSINKKFNDRIKAQREEKEYRP
jgi:hypothetical protein